MTLRPRFRNVLVATDFSASADLAFQRAAWLPLAPDPTFHVLAVTPEGVPSRMAAELDRDVKSMLAKASAELAASVEQKSGKAKVVPAVLRGTPFAEILRHARAEGVELIVLGRHGTWRIRDLFIGSTAERVVRKGEAPVLIVSQPASGRYQRPVAAVDVEDNSSQIVQFAAELLDEQAGPLTLLHASNLPFESTLARSWSSDLMEDYRREREETANAAMRRFAAGLEGLGLPLEVVVRSGDPRGVIIRELLHQRADLVALGTHGRSGLAHAVLGSVAEWIIWSAPCDVAITRPEPRAGES